MLHNHLSARDYSQGCVRMINFTPWRAHRTHQYQQRFLRYAGLSITLSIFIVATMAFCWRQQTNQLHQRNAEIIMKQKKLRPQVEHLTQLKQTVRKHQQDEQLTLQRHRQQQQYYQTLKWLALHWPANAYLITAQLSNQTYQLYGFAGTAKILTELIEQLRSLPYVKQIEFTDWQRIEMKQGKFSLQMQLMEPEHAATLG